jgi:hypothetical protein
MLYHKVNTNIILNPLSQAANIALMKNRWATTIITMMGAEIHSVLGVRMAI